MSARVTRLSSLVVAALALPLVACPPDRTPASAPCAGPVSHRLCNPHSIILVRHAEKMTADPDDRDPDLSPPGLERAARLAKLLGRTEVTRLIASEYKRTRHTLAPLAARAGKEVEVRNAGETVELIRELGNAPPGSTIVVATHSNVLPRIVADLGGGRLAALDPQGNLPDDEFGRVVVMSVGCGSAATVAELSSD